MDLVKKIVIYMMGIIALGVVAIIISMGYLVLVPDSQLLGYHYISGSLSVFNHEFSEGVATYTSINVESNGFDIELYPQDQSTDIEIAFENSANGFTKEEVTSFNYSYAYDAVTQTINIKVNEPYSGFIIYNKASIKIGIPNTTLTKSFDIKSNGGQVTIGQKTPIGNLEPLIFRAKDISIENGRAQMTLRNFVMSADGMLSITNISGITNISSNVAGNVELYSKIGSFNFGTEELPVNIGGDLIVVADNAFVRAGDIAENFSQIGDSGLIKLGKVEKDVYIKTENGEIEIDTVLGNLQIISEYNTIKIDNIGEEVSTSYIALIDSQNGNIEIGNCYYNLDVTATRGDITVLNAFYDTLITTTYGDVDVNYNEDALSYKMVGVDQVNITLTINTTQGNITATNLKTQTELSVSTSSTATITAEFLEINGTNSITGGRREFTVKVPVTAYTFNIATKSDQINILAGDAYKTSWQAAELVDGTYIYSKAMGAGSIINTLTITSTVGKINVLTNEATIG